VNRLLGPNGKGAYVASNRVAGDARGDRLFGLPNAMNYFAARGASVRRLLLLSDVSAVVISGAAIVLLWFALPVLETSILSAVAENVGAAAGDTCSA